MMSSKWDNRFLEMAKCISQWSKDPSTQVGCVIVDHNKIVVSVGYNGFPRGVADHQGRYDNRSIKYLLIQHAEANAVASAKEPLNGFTAYVTHHPCSNCAGMLIQSGIKSIVTERPDGTFAERFKESFEASKMMFDEAKVKVKFIP
jgi:dCMP deaminase